MQAILMKFDYENLLLKEYKNWYLLLRKEQVTLGSLVLIEKSFQTKYSNISSESFSEFGDIVKDIESTLGKLFSFDKINYIMLMMTDDEVHYHVIPRYSKDTMFSNVAFKDNGWSGLPDFANTNKIDSSITDKLLNSIKEELENK
jgi:diadenosine tetraphosphate (Ap4A) HIT family hydrolase